MCGIAGFIGEDQDKITRMVELLRHRGPDHQAAIVTHGASIGNARLAIIDPRPEGNQPMWNARRDIVITYNGEIYNYRELRDREGFACRTNSDTEVLLLLYERYGMAFVSRLRGMFALAIYDVRDRSFHLARDAGGILPLYVSYPHGKLHFASETRTLLKVLPSKPELDASLLSAYLRLQYIPGPATLCRGIEALPPGTTLTWKDGVSTMQTFVPATEPVRPFSSRRDFSARFPAIMSTVVRDHLLSDRPVGVFLSGGMDSSIILHHMCEHATVPVKTFTVRFDVTKGEDEARFNRDANLAKETARRYGTDHHELLLTAADFRDAYQQTAVALDQPNADSVAVAQFVLAKLAKNDVDVVLNGSGGDELFGGYPRYRVARILRALRAIPAAWRGFLGGMAGYPSDVLRMLPGPALAERLLARPAQEILPLVRGDWFDPDSTRRIFERRYEPLRALDPVRAFMEFDRSLWLVDESLRISDFVTLAHGLESRPPFLDPRLVAASHATPSHWHVTPRRTKALLKETYRTILPQHLFTVEKSSFYPPLAKWIRREAAPVVLRMLENPRIRQLFDVVAIRKVYEEHRDHRKYGLHALSSLAQLSAWFEGVYDA